METLVVNTDAFEMTEVQFVKFCTENRDLRIERDSNKQIFIMSPTFSFTGNFNTQIIFQLENWNRKHKPGYVFDSSTGFTLPNKAMRSPDTSWIKKERWETLSREEKESFAPIWPDFIIELKSKTDHLPALKNKMQEWMQNGCCLGWLIDLEEKKVYVYNNEIEFSIVEFSQKTISGGGILPGFELDLTELH